MSSGSFSINVSFLSTREKSLETVINRITPKSLEKYQLLTGSTLWNEHTHKERVQCYLNVVIIAVICDTWPCLNSSPQQITTEDIFQRTLTQVDQCAKWSIGRTPTDQRFSERFFFLRWSSWAFSPTIPLTNGFIRAGWSGGNISPPAGVALNKLGYLKIVSFPVGGVVLMGV